MSARSSDDSRTGRKESSTRNTARDVPAAKYKEGSVGTVAPRGLRGPSLLPGQGAPEWVNPEDVELAVLRDAETLDGPHVARVAQKRLPDPRAPSPTPVSVEVPRARSIAPAPPERPSTPPSPSARSIQSGTLMSMGSVDPRAPTELSLPSPRPLSVSERAEYLGPAAVVDRSPSVAPRELPDVAESTPFRGDSLRPGAASQRPSAPSQRPSAPSQRPSIPSAEAAPKSSSRSMPVGSGAISSARPSLRAESVAPPAQRVIRPPRPAPSVPPRPTPSVPPRPTPSVAPRPTPSVPPRPALRVPAPAHAPLSVPPPPQSVRDPRPEVPSSRRSAPRSAADVPPQFQIHSELDAVRFHQSEDDFDLRSASTQREPLASRKPLPSTDWTRHGPASGAAQRDGEPSSRGNRRSQPATFQTEHDTVPPTTDRVLPPARASVPVSWVLGAAAFALVLALIVAWVMRPSTAQDADGDAARATDGRARSSAVAPSPVSVPASDDPAEQRALPHGHDGHSPGHGQTNSGSPTHTRVAPKASSAGAARAQPGAAEQGVSSVSSVSSASNASDSSDAVSSGGHKGAIY